MIGWMKEYKTRLTAFKATTKIADYIKDCIDEELMDDADEALDGYHDKQFYRKLAFILWTKHGNNLKVDENCLSYIDELWTSLSDHFILPRLPMFLEKMVQGGIIRRLYKTVVDEKIADVTEV